jgi:thiol-disulfide isomerase/thioredoxin
VAKFNEIVNTFKKNIIAVEFFADWCNPCRSFKPIYESIQQQYGIKGIIFTRINSEEFAEVSEQFNIMGVPAFIFIKNKKVLQKQSGTMSKGQFVSIIDSLLQKSA